MVPLPRNKKQAHRLNSMPQMWPSGLILTMTLTLNFQCQIWNLLYLSQKMVRLPRNEKQTYRLISRPQMWPPGLTLAMTLTIKFQGQIWNFPYLGQKLSHCHKTKSKQIDWTPGLKSDHQLAMTLTMNFQGQIWIFLYINQSGPIATKRKANISIELQASNVTNGFDLGHDLDIWIFKVKCDLDLLVTKVRCKDLPDSDRVTSDVGVPSTYLVHKQRTLFVTMRRCESMCGNNNKTGRISSTHSDILYRDLEKVYVKVVNINSTFRERQNIWLVAICETQRNICEAPAYCNVASKDMKLASLVYIVTERCYDWFGDSFLMSSMVRYVYILLQ